MKKRCLLLAAILLSSMLSSVAAPFSTEAAAADEWEAYSKYLKNHPNPYVQDSFAVIDINDDGVDELIVTPDELYHMELYGYVNGKVKLIGGGYSGAQRFYPSKGIYYSSTTHMGAVDEWYYSYNGKKLSLLATSFGSEVMNCSTGERKAEPTPGDFSPYGYKVKGKDVNEKKYNSFIKKTLNGAKKSAVDSTDLKLYKNTQKNRKKVFG